MDIIINKSYRKYAYAGNKELHDFKSKVNLFDTAVAIIGQSIYEGQITMVNFRGIDMITPWGVQFVKWVNVKAIKKEDSDNGSNGGVSQLI